MGRPKGYKHTEESKRKMSLAKLGIPKSEEHKKHMSESKKGKVITEEVKKHMSEGWKRRREYRRRLKIVPAQKDDPVIEANPDKPIQIGRIDIQKYVGRYGKIIL